MLASQSPAAPLPAAATSPLAPAEITDAERARLVRLCVRYTRDPDAAEDLAQETLVEAWRGWHKLRDASDPQARANWLAAIAANVCRRWARRRGREAIRLVRLEGPPADDAVAEGADAWLAQELGIEDDVAAELEQDELRDLLDKALALLPPKFRDLLLARYLLERPVAQIATDRGLSEATLAVQLHRARKALRGLLDTALRPEAVTFGLLAEGAGDGWQETRIWCPTCGHARMRGWFDGAAQHLALRCPRCAGEHGELLDHVSYQSLLAGVRSVKAALNRVMAWADPYYRGAVEAREVVCPRCGRRAPVLLAPVPGTPASRRAEPGLHAACTCPAQNNSTLTGLALFTPQARRFWREYPRIRLAPLRHVETGGREAFVVGYESVTGRARLDTLFARDTFELLAIHRSPRAEALSAEALGAEALSAEGVRGTPLQTGVAPRAEPG